MSRFRLKPVLLQGSLLSNALPHCTSWCRRLAIAIIALITIIPIGVVFSALFQPDPEIWSHLWQYTLPELLSNTAWLIAGTSLGVTLTGVSLAWLTATCQFPGRRFFNWALLLPMALPAYITAFVWLGLLDYSGPLSTWLRNHFGITHVFDFRSRSGVIFVMTLALYPYVYLITKTTFQGQGPRLLEAAQTLGCSRFQAFFTVALPVARPGIVAGLLLTCMETLADFGTVSVFNYNTFTTAIYKAWFSLFSLPAASQLASLLMLFVFIAMALEHQQQAKRQYATSTRAATHAQRISLSKPQALLAFGWCTLIFLLAFAIPIYQLASWAANAWAQDFDTRYLEFAWHSLALSGLGALLVCIFAFILSYAQRKHPSMTMQWIVRLSNLGYALPGTILAVGFFIPIAWLDNLLINHFNATQQLFSGTLVVMLLAYCARFLAVSFNPLQAGLSRISKSIDEAAQSLGHSNFQQIRRIHLPILRPTLFTAATLTFVDIMKELPITLMTRPFGWDTLAVRVFEMTSEGEWERAALPACAIALVGLIPVILLVKHIEHAQT